MKKVGINASKIGWFWFIEILLIVIVIRFIEKVIDFTKSIITGNWSPGQMFEGITGILAIIGTSFMGIFLLLVYTGKIKTEGTKKQEYNTFQQIEILSKKNIDIYSLIRTAKDEVDIVYSPITYLINELSENINIFKEGSNICNVKILIQNPIVISYLYEKQKGTYNPSLMSTNEGNNNNYCNRYIKSSYKLKTELESKGVKNIEIRMVDVPNLRSMIIIDPNVEGNNNANSAIYIEPFLFSAIEDYPQQLQILYKIRSNPKTKTKEITNFDKVNNLFDIEYLNFLNLWKVAVPFDNNYDS